MLSTAISTVFVLHLPFCPAGLVSALLPFLPVLLSPLLLFLLLLLLLLLLVSMLLQLVILVLSLFSLPSKFCMFEFLLSAFDLMLLDLVSVLSNTMLGLFRIAHFRLSFCIFLVAESFSVGF